MSLGRACCWCLANVLNISMLVYYNDHIVLYLESINHCKLIEMSMYDKDNTVLQNASDSLENSMMFNLPHYLLCLLQYKVHYAPPYCQATRPVTWQ